MIAEYKLECKGLGKSEWMLLDPDLTFETLQDVSDYLITESKDYCDEHGITLEHFFVDDDMLHEKEYKDGALSFERTYRITQGRD